MRSLLIMLMASTIVGAPQANSQDKRPKANSAESSAIRGRVLNAVTGEPLRKVDLILRRVDVGPNTYSPTSYSASTDAAGRFVMRDIAPGQYRLLGEHSGVVSTEYGSRGPARAGLTLSIDGSRPLQDIVFQLTPHAVIAGRVTDADREPAPNVQVQAMRYSFVRGRKQLSSFGHASTNDLGEYRIVGLAPGRYYLIADYGAPAMLNSTAVENYAPTYYPGTADVTLAVPIDVTTASELRNGDFALAKTRTVRIRGHIANSSTPGKSMFTIMLVHTDQSAVGDTPRTYVASPQGDFDIRGVMPGTYTFVASIFEGGTYTTGKKLLDATNDVDDFAISVTPGLEVRGSFSVEGDAKPNLSDIRISLLPFDGSEIWSPMPNTQVKQDGTFTLSNVGPDDNYNLAVLELPDGYYVKSIRMGDTEVLERGLNVRESPDPINIVLSPGAARVEGAVLNMPRGTIPGATVVLIPQDEKRRKQIQFYSVTTTDQYGRFALKNLYPGNYELFAWEDLEYDAFLAPDFMALFADKGAPLTIQESRLTKIQLKLIEAGQSQKN